MAYVFGDFSNFGSLKSTETYEALEALRRGDDEFQQFRLVEEH